MVSQARIVAGELFQIAFRCSCDLVPKGDITLAFSIGGGPLKRQPL
jgi:hypothetical protein